MNLVSIDPKMDNQYIVVDEGKVMAFIINVALLHMQH